MSTSERYGQPSLIMCASRGGRLWMWCPGCDDLHSVTLADWKVDTTDLDRPTVSPSILVSPVFGPPEHARPKCHSYLVAGVWEFLHDSEHEFAGRRVGMMPLPTWFVHQDDGGVS